MLLINYSRYLCSAFKLLHGMVLRQVEIGAKIDIG